MTLAVDRVPPLLLDQLSLKGRMVISVQAVLYSIERRHFPAPVDGQHEGDFNVALHSRELESRCVLPGIDDRLFEVTRVYEGAGFTPLHRQSDLR